MIRSPIRSRILAGLAVLAVTAWTSAHARAESCQTASDMEDATRSAITSAGLRYFEMIAKGDTAALRLNAIPNVASDFSGIEAQVKDQQHGFAGARPTTRSSFLLEAEGAAPIARAEFYCGVFGKNGQTAGSAVFVLTDLSPGKYAVVILDASSPAAAHSVSFILQQVGSDWKLGSLYIQPSQSTGHDSNWFVSRAREYKAKGQMHNAWLYYLQARSLVSPLPFMSTQATDKLFDESQGLQSADIPADGKPVDLLAGTATYKLTALFPHAVGNDLDLIVKYQASDVSNTNQAYQSNVAVIKAVVAKYPELRDAFAAVVARAVESGGRDYGTLVAMKDIK
jgi:hypothetical protein